MLNPIAGTQIGSTAEKLGDEIQSRLQRRAADGAQPQHVLPTKDQVVDTAKKDANALLDVQA